MSTGGVERGFRLEPLDRVNPFIITYLAVKQGYATDLEQCLRDAFWDVASAQGDEGDSVEEFDLSPIGTLSTSELIDWLSPRDGYPSPVLQRYLEYTAELSPENFKHADPTGLQLAVLSITE